VKKGLIAENKITVPVNLVASMPPMVSSAWPTDFGVRYRLNKAGNENLEKGLFFLNGKLTG